MSWFEKSLMAGRGAACGVAGARSSIADQGRFHDVYGPHADPVIGVAPGAVVALPTTPLPCV